MRDFDKKWETAHIMEHMAFGANNGFATGSDYDAVFTENGAYHNAWTSDVSMCYVAECASFEWERILGLQKSAICDPKFTEEEFDAETAMDSTQKRPMIPRRKIQAQIARIEVSGLDPSTGVELARTITKAYSGYIHAASPQIMDMYGGSPPHFHVTGMLGTQRHAEHRQDLWNYFYRSILSFGLAAKAFGDHELSDQIHTFTVRFEEAAGKNYSPKAGPK